MRLDALYDVKWWLIKQASFAWIDVLDKIKHKTPAQVVTATAVTFLLVCERFDLDPRHVLTVADRVVRRARDVDPPSPDQLVEGGHR